MQDLADDLVVHVLGGPAAQQSAAETQVTPERLLYVAVWGKAEVEAAAAPAEIVVADRVITTARVISTAERRVVYTS